MKAHDRDTICLVFIYERRSISSLSLLKPLPIFISRKSGVPSPLCLLPRANPKMTLSKLSPPRLTDGTIPPPIISQSPPSTPSKRQSPRSSRKRSDTPLQLQKTDPNQSPSVHIGGLDLEDYWPDEDPPLLYWKGPNEPPKLRTAKDFARQNPELKPKDESFKEAKDTEPRKAKSKKTLTDPPLAYRAGPSWETGTKTHLVGQCPPDLLKELKALRLPLNEKEEIPVGGTSTARKTTPPPSAASDAESAGSIKNRSIRSRERRAERDPWIFEGNGKGKGKAKWLDEQGDVYESDAESSRKGKGRGRETRDRTDSPGSAPRLGNPSASFPITPSDRTSLPPKKEMRNPKPTPFDQAHQSRRRRPHPLSLREKGVHNAPMAPASMLRRRESKYRLLGWDGEVRGKGGGVVGDGV